ncbi:L-aspartate oxidase [Lentisphaera araneosa HTCC2155]|uniref:L-aspartate oxidase n=1 Tax=Lentisphaera araneosa HTCC2155 TaxID=313628 RepID=A6DPX6_9BACT|nr:L-aspartate oxidase [Lentisphaera araneosa]EDM26217.1 L-aspartate oxidase [Lentisphaera araneosa HTCC2155]
MNKVEHDFLIIGSGLAGMYCALQAAEHGSVALISKRELSECNSKYAQGGISCVMTDINDQDSFELHVSDTLKAGAGLCNEEVVSDIVSAGPKAIKKLIDLGVKFTRRSEVDESDDDEAGQYNLGREGGHSQRRVLHAGDITGTEVIRALEKACRLESRIEIFENYHSIDLITTGKLGWGLDKNNCLGAYILDKDNDRVTTFLAKSTILATGGAGKVYTYTTNPDIATGDGIAMAYRANADIANMEFFQFHPTCLYDHRINSFLISEAVRGEGAILKVRRKKQLVDFMEKYHPLKSLAPRDVVARAIDRELKETGEKCVYLDITHHDEEFLRKRFPKIFKTCESIGLNMAEDPIPVVPAAHYCCGGVKTDICGTTNITRLYAIGETACTGLHGANRLASNSLLEAVVMGGKSAKCAAEMNASLSNSILETQMNAVPSWSSGNATDSDEQVVITHNWQEIRSFMWDFVGIFRTNKRLQRAKRRIRNIQHEITHYYWDFNITPDLIELRNLACLAELIIDCALSRQESRGLHFNLDYPEKLDQAIESHLRKF